MTTATHSTPPFGSAQDKRPTKTAGAPESARVTKLRHAHLLATVVFNDYVREAGFARESGVSRARVLAEFQKALILQTAVKLGWPVESRKDLSAMQLGAICGALRKQMDERGIAIPRARKSGRRGELADDAAATQEEQQLILDLLGRCMTDHKWTQSQAEQFLRRQLHRWNLDWPETHGQARAVMFGLKAILRRDNEGK